MRLISSVALARTREALPNGWDKMDVGYTKADGLNCFAEKVVSALGLVPEAIPDEVKGKNQIKRLLNNLVSISHIMAELTGLYGAGHGRSGDHGGMESRHARLAATSAIALPPRHTGRGRSRVEASE